MNAVDTNVFVCALDVDEPIKQAKAQDLFQRLALAAGSTVLPWQVADSEDLDPGTDYDGLTVVNPFA